jgi:hypothetical protein
MQMPLVMFWSANKQIDRLQAEQAQMNLQVGIAGQSGEGAKELFAALKLQVGSPAVVIKGFDEAKFLELQRKLNPTPKDQPAPA